MTDTLDAEEKKCLQSEKSFCALLLVVVLNKSLAFMFVLTHTPCDTTVKHCSVARSLPAKTREMQSLVGR